MSTLFPGRTVSCLALVFFDRGVGPDAGSNSAAFHGVDARWQEADPVDLPPYGVAVALDTR